MSLHAVRCASSSVSPVRNWSERFALAFAAALASAGCVPGATRVDATAETQRLLQADRDFAALADRVGDADAFYTYMTDRTIQLPADEPPVHGRAAVRDGLRGLAPNHLRWTPREAAVSDDGTLGWTWGEWELVGPDAGPTLLGHGKYVNVWSRQPDGSWKVVVDVGNAARKR
jgi:ketosteroid isomerase-like protein